MPARLLVVGTAGGVRASEFGVRRSDLNNCTCTAASGLPSVSVTLPKTLPGGVRIRLTSRCSAALKAGRVAVAAAPESEARIFTGPDGAGKRNAYLPLGLV